MESIISLIKQHSVKLFDDSDFKSLREKINERFSVIHVASTSVSGNETVLMISLQSLLSAEYFTGLAVMLAIQAESLPSSCNSAFVNMARVAIGLASKQQALLAHKDVVSICRKVLLICTAADTPRACVRLLLSASALLAPREYCLTPVHSMFIQACVSAEMYSFATSVLSNSLILEVNLKSTDLQAIDFLTFFYYGGLCFAALKEFESALEYFSQVLTTPAHAVSAVAVAALHKAQLISLISAGEKFVVPKSASSPVLKYSQQLDAEAGFYVRLTQLFVADLPVEAAALVQQHADLLERNGDRGLAGQVLEAFSVHRLRRLSLSYTSRLLGDVLAAVSPTADDSTAMTTDSSPVGCASALSALEQLVSKGLLQAKVDQVNGVVVFHDSLAGDSTVGVSAASALQKHLTATLELLESLQAMHTESVSSAAYVKKGIASKLGAGTTTAWSME